MNYDVFCPGLGIHSHAFKLHLGIIYVLNILCQSLSVSYILFVICTYVIMWEEISINCIQYDPAYMLSVGKCCCYLWEMYQPQTYVSYNHLPADSV